MRRKLGCIFLLCVFLTFSGITHAERLYFSVSVQADVITASARVRYAGDRPYISLGDLLGDVGGAVNVTPERLLANYAGVTAALHDNGVAVAAPGVTFSLIYPARAQNGDVFISRADVTDFFAHAFDTRVVEAEQARPLPELTPIVPPADPLTDEDSEPPLDTLDPPEEVAPDVVEPELQPIDPEAEVEPEPEPETPPEPAAPTPATPGVFNVIMLDPGHGGQDIGSAMDDTFREKEFTLDMAVRMQRMLAENTEMNISLTREEDKDLSQSMRATAANAAHAELLISIHAAYAPSPNAAGVTLFTDQPPPVRSGMSQEARRDLDDRRIRGEQAATVAYHIAQHIADENALGTVTVRAAPLLLQRHADMPCIVMEVGYFSNPETAPAWTEEEYREQAATTLTLAIADALHAMAEEAQ